MKTIKYFLILFFGTVISYGQQLPTVVPPSPEASSAFKFTEMPVSLYTGMPNISIPLFEIESGGVSVPISISYHARGVQVAEIAPRVGTGWALNCGGMVTKQVREKDDVIGWQCLDYDEFYDSVGARIITMNSTIGNICDMMPDQYSFSANGLSGKIMRDLVGGGFVTQQYSNIIVGSSPLDLTDSNGNHYLFGENLKSDVDRVTYNLAIHVDGNYTKTYPDGSPFPNTWHLTSIKTAKGANVQFYYSTEVTNYTKRSKDQATFTGVDSYAALTTSEQQRIDSISFDKGKLKFEYSTNEREDMPGSHSLHKIALYNINGEKIKQAIFDYEYTTSTVYSNINWHLVDDEESFKRLFLKSVQFADKDGNTLPPYQFEYNPTVLPSRHSNSVDVWGYYNGKNNGDFLETYFDDRTVDVDKVQAGLLKTIIKPEGGLTNFYYEPNIAVNVFPNTVSFGNPNPYTPKHAHLGSLFSTVTGPEGLDDETGALYYSGGAYADVFTISALQTGTIKYSVWGKGVEGCNCPGITGCVQDATANCLFSIKIKKLNPSTNVFDSIAETLHQGQNRIIYLQPGTYKLTVEYLVPGQHYPMSPEEFFDVYISWNEEIASFASPEIQCINDPENLTGTKVVYAAGNRIQKIEYKDSPDATVALVKTYSYTNPATGETSGRILGLTNFVGLTDGILNGQAANAETDPWGSGGGSNFSTYQGNNVGYKYVTEYYGEGQNAIGRIDYEYSMVYDTGRYYEFPYHPSTDNEWLRGKELKVKIYKKQGNDYQIIRKTENTYLFADSQEFTGLPLCEHPFFKPSLRIPITQDIAQSGGYAKNKRYFTIPASMIPVYLPNDTIVGADPTGYKTYYMTGGALDLKRTVTTEYPDTGNEIINTTEYNYRYDNHYNVAQQSSVTSDGTIALITKYFYPNDPETVGEPARADLIAENMQVPLVTQSFRGSTKLSETETTFKDWNPDNAIRLMEPEYIKTAKGDAATENRLQYMRRDTSTGNILEVKQTSGTTVSYIWGYNGTYPLAKIENATFAQVVSALGTTEAALKALTVAPANIRTLLPNAIITTYTYKPLVGVTSITDPKGDVLNYEYDSFGRLKFVRDKSGNTLSENQYNYRP